MTLAGRERRRRIVACITSENSGMLGVARAAGVQTRRSPQDPTLSDMWMGLPSPTPRACVVTWIHAEPAAGGRR
jgi:hypothetical protein